MVLNVLEIAEDKMHAGKHLKMFGVFLSVAGEPREGTEVLTTDGTDITDGPQPSLTRAFGEIRGRSI
jgi:hypothetical protein